MEFFNEAVRVLETLVKALNGDFAPDWKSCHKRSFPGTVHGRLLCRGCRHVA